MSPLKYVLICTTAITLFLDSQVSVSAAPLQRTKREEKYTTKYDSFDVAKVFASKRFVRVHMNCLLNKGPCTPEGKELKKFIPDVFATQCSKCSDVQKKQAGIVLSHILLNYRDDFNALADLYDPDGTARKPYNIDQYDEDYEDLEES